ncbi:MAG: cyclomaltodextrinase [Rhodothermales bacterium]|jgi:cyclomaltodextrinase
MNVIKRSFLIGCAAFLVGSCLPPDEDHVAPPTPLAGETEWAADMVWYQIFPERFRNGDPSNDPPRSSLPNVRAVPDSWATTPWTSDWYDRADWEKEMSDDYYRTVRQRRYGGDLQGVIDKLDYLQGLGVNGIYFNPLFWARSEHKYDGNTYHHIDPYFGPDPHRDFSLMETETSDPSTWRMTSADSLFFVMVGDAHTRGIRIVIDGVFNHTGQEFFAFRDLHERQRESPYVDWYTVLEWDDPSTPESEFDWQGWWDHRPLPEFADTQDGTDLQPGPKKYIFDATQRWMDPNGDGDPSDGVDGWRLDVVADVPVGFWTDWNAHVRSINPQAYTVAELWEDASSTLVEGGFSATMNYFGFAFPVKGYLIDGKMKPTDFVDALNTRRLAHADGVARALQNLIDSHDTDRVASMISNARRELPYEREDWELWFDYDWGNTGTPAADAAYPIRAPSGRDRTVQRLVTLFQMTYVGAPMVYYGTEAGMWSPDDPDDRQPMWWGDMDFDAVRHHPRTGALARPIAVGFDPVVSDFYKAAIALRRSHPSLNRGDFRVLATDDTAQSLAFAREHEEEAVVVVLNRSDGPQTVRFSEADAGLSRGKGLYPVFTTGADPVISVSDGTVSVSLPALTGVAFIRTGIE